MSELTYTNQPVEQGTEAARAGEQAVASPCVRNCCLDQQDICLGCGRTLAEILAWGSASRIEKQQILAKIARRRSPG